VIVSYLTWINIKSLRFD